MPLIWCATLRNMQGNKVIVENVITNDILRIGMVYKNVKNLYPI